jgi:hypothetical protein
MIEIILCMGLNLILPILVKSGLVSNRLKLKYLQIKRKAALRKRS